MGDALDRAGRRDEARERSRRRPTRRGASATSARSPSPRWATRAWPSRSPRRTRPPSPCSRRRSTGSATTTALRARLLAALALEAYYGGADTARRRASEAVQLARGARDAATLAHTLSAQHLALWDGDHVHDRLGVAGEMARVARAAKDRVALLQARNWRFIDLLELGQTGEAEAEMPPTPARPPT